MPAPASTLPRPAAGPPTAPPTQRPDEAAPAGRRAGPAHRRGRRPARQPAADPTPAAAGLAPAELEFLAAIQEYKQQSGRMFPTWSEVLEVLTGLGYRKAAEPGLTRWIAGGRS